MCRFRGGLFQIEPLNCLNKHEEERDDLQPTTCLYDVRLDDSLLCRVGEQNGVGEPPQQTKPTRQEVCKP